MLELTKEYLPFHRYSVPDHPYSILANSNSDTLNSLIKNILKDESDKSGENEFLSELGFIEFDLYVNGNFLDTTLNEHIKSDDQIKIVSKQKYINFRSP